jgi:hypothetical protein
MAASVKSVRRPGPPAGARFMRRLLIATLLVLMALPAAAIAADSPSDLLIDACRDEHVDGTYSQATYRRALNQLPADSDEYTACREVIERARLAALKNRSSSGSSGSATPAPAAPSSGSGGGNSSSGTPAPSTSTPATSAPRTNRRSSSKAKRTRRDSTPPTTTTTQAPAAEPLLPVGPVGNVTAPATRLPTPVVVLLAALALVALLAAATIGWNRVVARRLR